MDSTPRALRTLVFLPAHDPDAILENATYGMDALCLDLEDLTPQPEKARARQIFPELAGKLDASGIAVFARTNALEGGYAQADLDAIVCPELHCVSLPKAESAAEVIRFCALLEASERRNGVPVGSVLVRPIVETARGIHFAFEIASASPRVAYMGGVAGGWWGDLGTSIGYTPTASGHETRYLRSRVLLEVRAAGVAFPIGGVARARDGEEALRAFARENQELGYAGLHCTSTPDVLRVVNEVFSPTLEQIERWQGLLPKLEQAERDGYVAVRFDGETFDMVGLDRVRQQLELARRIGLLTD